MVLTVRTANSTSLRSVLRIKFPGTVRKGLGIMFVGEIRNEAMVYVFDAYADGFQLEDQVRSILLMGIH